MAQLQAIRRLVSFHINFSPRRRVVPDFCFPKGIFVKPLKMSGSQSEFNELLYGKSQFLRPLKFCIHFERIWKPIVFCAELIFWFAIRQKHDRIIISYESALLYGCINRRNDHWRRSLIFNQTKSIKK